MESSKNTPSDLLWLIDLNLDDVPINLTAELAQTRMSFHELLNLEVGDIIRCSRSSGENIDVFAENVLVGWGEVLMLDGVMTIRIADIRNALLPDIEEQLSSEIVLRGETSVIQ